MMILDIKNAITAPQTLLSPLGLSPGLLYSAIKILKPSRLIVLTSVQGKDSLTGIIQRAGFQGTVQAVLVNDPFNCFKQAAQKTEELLAVIDNSHCVVNLTGGTTAIQFIIQRAGAALENKGLDVTYVALIDRRDFQAQRNDPWVVGELVTVM